MKRKVYTILVITGGLACLLVLREFGFVDLSWYNSKISGRYAAGTTTKRFGGTGPISYHLVVKHGAKTFIEHTHIYNNQPLVELQGTLTGPVYSGNCALPLAKNFAMTYEFSFSTVESSNGCEVSGHVNGQLEALVRGICSRRTARALTWAEARDQITKCVQSQLGQ